MLPQCFFTGIKFYCAFDGAEPKAAVKVGTGCPRIALQSAESFCFSIIADSGHFPIFTQGDLIETAIGAYPDILAVAGIKQVNRTGG